MDDEGGNFDGIQRRGQKIPKVSHVLEQIDKVQIG